MQKGFVLEWLPAEGFQFEPQSNSDLGNLVALVVKNPPASARGVGSIPGSGRFPGVGSGNPLQYSWLEKFHGQSSLMGYNPWGCKELDTTKHTHK